MDKIKVLMIDDNVQLIEAVKEYFKSSKLVEVVSSANDGVEGLDKIEKEVYNLIGNANSSLEVNNILESNLENIDNIVKSYNVPYNINYGSNYFPTKNYKGVMYPAGNYDSLVITLGKGTGSNFWCVLFPPLCLLDNDKKDISDIEYKSYVKKLLDKF